MDCPYCKEDLHKLENFDNINQFNECPSCKNQVWLDYDETLLEDENGHIDNVWEHWNWLKKSPY